jgi:hypothetical protein
MLRSLFFFFSFVSIIAANPSGNGQIQLNGAYKYPGNPPKMISFSLNWYERNGIVKGLYVDNYFSVGEVLSGEDNPEGAHLFVTFPKEKLGTKSLVFFLPHPLNSKNLQNPVSLITRDQQGNVENVIALQDLKLINSSNAGIQLQEEDECSKGFGELSGHCGVYAGLVSEEEDRRNICNLLFAQAVRLELTLEGTLYLHLGEVNELVSGPGHLIGRIPFNPQKKSLDVMSRICEQMIGVKSSTDSCKIVHLKGVFSTELENKIFKGTYRISEEGTNNHCLYKLSLEKRS